MKERDLAAELQQQKDDESAWEVPSDQSQSSPKSSKRRLGAMVSVRLAESELELVQKQAKAAGQTVSAYLRGLALGAAEDPSKGAAPWYSIGYSLKSSSQTIQYPQAAALTTHAKGSVSRAS